MYLLSYAYNALVDYGKHTPWCAAMASRLLTLLAFACPRPVKALLLLVRAARACPNLRRQLQLEARLQEWTARLDLKDLDWQAVSSGTTDRLDVPKSIILKPPLSPNEKGVLYVTFEEQWLRILRSGQAAAIAERYDLILGPTWSPPHDLPLLLAARLWPGRLFTLLSNLDDAATMRRLSPKLEPIPLLASHWVNPDIYRPYLDLPKEHDVIMLANFAPYKRHWLFFQMLRQLPRRYKVVVMGVPLGRRTEAVLRAEAQAFGVQDRFELRMRLSDDAIAEALCRSRTSLIFSAQEGSCIAVAESLFADTPVGLFYDARIGSKVFLNPATGRLLEPGNVAAQVADFIETSALYQPRAWALENISCEAGHAILNQHLKDAARRAGRPWAVDVLPFYQNALPRYVDPEQEQEMSCWHEDFAQRYGIRLGPPPMRESPVAERRLARPASLANLGAS